MIQLWLLLRYVTDLPDVRSYSLTQIDRKNLPKDLSDPSTRALLLHQIDLGSNLAIAGMESTAEMGSKRRCSKGLTNESGLVSRVTNGVLMICNLAMCTSSTQSANFPLLFGTF